MRLLDLFCGAGGAAMGYHRAGFNDIMGVDIVDQPDYPFTFSRNDALTIPKWKNFDLIHASPPCQAYTTMSNRHGRSKYALLPAIRERLTEWGLPFVIENVVGARRHLITPITLTGEMFGLTVHRPRLFELGGWYAITPHNPPRQKDPVAVYGKPDGRRLWNRKDGTQLRAWTLEQGREAMGMPWVTEERGIREAIPPAYTEYLGTQFLDQLARQG